MTTMNKPRLGSISGYVIDCGKPEVAKTDSSKTSRDKSDLPMKTHNRSARPMWRSSA